MIYIHDVLRNRLLLRAGLVELPKPKYSLKQLEESQWSPLFETLMRNRLIMGAFRYGPFNFPGYVRPKYNRIGSIKKRLTLYEQSGNTEVLVDIANLCLLEFVEGVHPKRHFHASDNSVGCDINYERK
jgi:hypothetical protein